MISNEFPADLCGDTLKGVDYKMLDYRQGVLFSRRNRLGGEAFLACHSVHKYPQRFMKTHPEWFAKGYDSHKIPPQPCFTAPGLAEQTAADAKLYFSTGKKPLAGQVAGNYFSVVPNDTTAFCKCEECRKWYDDKPNRGKGQYSTDQYSNYVNQFVNKVARLVAKDYPDKFISAIGYSKYAYPPDKFKMEPNVAIQLCMFPRHGFYLEKMASDENIFQSWVKNTPENPKFLWLYCQFPNYTMLLNDYRGFPGFAADSMAKWLKDKIIKGKIRGIFIEPSYLRKGRSPLIDQLDLYLLQKIWDDPTVDTQKLKNEFFERYYGNAAGPMKKFYEKIEQVYTNPDNYPDKGMHKHQGEEQAWKYLGTDEVMKQLAGYIAEARKTAKTDLEKQRVALFDKGIWQFMLAGKKEYRITSNLRKYTMKEISVPMIQNVNGIFSKINWLKAAKLEGWREMQGKKTQRKISGRITRDDQYLYLKLIDKMNPKELKVVNGNIWNDDDWEIFLGNSRKRPYCQIGIGVDGKFVTLKSTEGGFVNWQASLIIKSDQASSEQWVVYAAVPLKDIDKDFQEKGVLYLNVIRSTPEKPAVAWIPTFGGFHAPDRFGKCVL